DVSVDQINLIYLGLAYLYYDEGDFLSTAVVADHLARNYPDALGAKTAAKLALKAWVMEYSAAEGDRRFETDQVVSIAHYMAERWPEAEETADAVFVLLNFAVRDGDIDTAMDYLKRIPTASSRRGEAELKVGVSLWRVYLTELRKPPETRLSK